VSRPSTSQVGQTAIRLLRDVRIPLRDGVSTSAEVWLPDDGAAHPAILVRTPYLKEATVPTATIDSRTFVERGYAVVVQDVRGRGQSGGVFLPFVHEEADGYDSVEWVARQEWCTSEVVMAGDSYLGATQWLSAVAGPPSLRAIAPTLSADAYGEGWSYRAAIPEHGFLASWCAAELAAEPDRLLDDPASAWTDLERAKRVAPWLRDWLANGPDTDYWRQISVSHRRAEIAVPVLVVAGWYDIFLAASLRSFARSQNPDDRLIVGPWSHVDGLSHLVGAGNVGSAGSGVSTFATDMLDFYDAVLAGVHPPHPRVKAYVLGRREWIGLDRWPPEDTATTSLALEPGNFDVDSVTPVPSLGGRGLLVHVPGSGCGIADQSQLLGRPDVHEALRHRTTRDLLLAGPVTVLLSTGAEPDSGSDRLWVATLALLQQTGELHNLAEGIAAACARDVSLQVDLGDVLVWVPAGSTLVLLVAGSSFPRWPAPQTSGRQSVLRGSELVMTVAPPELLVDSHG
jgi:uncharacterized protein